MKTWWLQFTLHITHNSLANVATACANSPGYESLRHANQSRCSTFSGFYHGIAMSIWTLCFHNGIKPFTKDSQRVWTSKSHGDWILTRWCWFGTRPCELRDTRNTPGKNTWLTDIHPSYLTVVTVSYNLWSPRYKRDSVIHQEPPFLDHTFQSHSSCIPKPKDLRVSFKQNFLRFCWGSS